MEYRATLDLTSKVITGLITILFLSIIIFPLLSGSINIEALTFSTVLLITIYSVCYLYRPTKYIVNTENVIIKRPIKDVTIDIKKIKDIFPTKKESMQWTIRTFGNGGLFGYYGKFRNGLFGNMTWYATRKNNFLVIEMYNNEKIVLTPDDTKMFAAIKKNIDANVSK